VKQKSIFQRDRLTSSPAGTIVETFTKTFGLLEGGGRGKEEGQKEKKNIRKLPGFGRQASVVGGDFPRDERKKDCGRGALFDRIKSYDLGLRTGVECEKLGESRQISIQPEGMKKIYLPTLGGGTRKPIYYWGRFDRRRDEDYI